MEVSFYPYFLLNYTFALTLAVNYNPGRQTCDRILNDKVWMKGSSEVPNLKSEWKRSLLLLAGLALAPFAAVGQQSRPVDDIALRNAGKTGAEWLSYGSTPGETRYSPLNQINTGNVNRLGLAWSYDIGPGGGAQEATPLVWNGTIYSITNWSVVYAVDARTGKERWRWDPQVNRTALQPVLCCGAVLRGLALYQGKIIAPILDGRLDALDAETGKWVWEARVAFTQDMYTITMAPRIAKGKVIIGVAGAEYPVRGFFAAYDANTGQLAWKFYTVPGDPSKPFENDAMRKAAATWTGDWWKYGGGGTLWDAISYDPDANLLYVGTGNAGPWAQAVRGQKAMTARTICMPLPSSRSIPHGRLNGTSRRSRATSGIMTACSNSCLPISR